jgi:hypothetical protein
LFVQLSQTQTRETVRGAPAPDFYRSQRRKRKSFFTPDTVFSPTRPASSTNITLRPAIFN